MRLLALAELPAMVLVQSVVDRDPHELGWLLTRVAGRRGSQAAFFVVCGAPFIVDFRLGSPRASCAACRFFLRSLNSAWVRRAAESPRIPQRESVRRVLNVALVEPPPLTGLTGTKGLSVFPTGKSIGWRP